MTWKAPIDHEAEMQARLDYLDYKIQKALSVLPSPPRDLVEASRRRPRSRPRPWWRRLLP